MEELHEHHHHDHEGSSLATVLTVLVVLVVLGFLLWNFLPLRGERSNTLDVNINTPNPTEQVQ